MEVDVDSIPMGEPASRWVRPHGWMWAVRVAAGCGCWHAEVQRSSIDMGAGAICGASDELRGSLSTLDVELSWWSA